MKKITVILSVLIFALTSQAQVSWGGGPAVNVAISGSFERQGVLVEDYVVYEGNVRSDVGDEFPVLVLSGFDVGHNATLSGTFVDADSSSFGTYGGNFTFGFNNNDAFEIVDADTFIFEFTIPTTTNGFVTGVTLISDPDNFFAEFEFSFDGAGGMTVTQTGVFSFPGTGPHVFTVDFTTAVPEPATTAMLFALVTGVVVVWRRRRASC